MLKYRKFLAFAFLFQMFFLCIPAYANGIAPYVMYFPGLIFFNFHYAFPASILVSIIERPFLSLSGIKINPLRYSLQANFISTIVGIVIAPIGFMLLYTVGPLWFVIIFGISSTVEIHYLQFKGLQFNKATIIFGNFLSCMLLIYIPLLATSIKNNHYTLAYRLVPHSTWMNWTAFTISILVFLYSFVSIRKQSNQSHSFDETSDLQLSKDKQSENSLA